MSVITKILCSVTLLVAAVSLTIPSQVFAGGPSFAIEHFNISITNSSQKDIFFTVCYNEPTAISNPNYYSNLETNSLQERKILKNTTFTGIFDIASDKATLPFRVYALPYTSESYLSDGYGCDKMGSAYKYAEVNLKTTAANFTIYGDSSTENISINTLSNPQIHVADPLTNPAPIIQFVNDFYQQNQPYYCLDNAVRTGLEITTTTGQHKVRKAIDASDTCADTVDTDTITIANASQNKVNVDGYRFELSSAYGTNSENVAKAYLYDQDLHTPIGGSLGTPPIYEATSGSGIFIIPEARNLSSFQSSQFPLARLDRPFPAFLNGKTYTYNLVRAKSFISTTLFPASPYISIWRYYNTESERQICVDGTVRNPLNDAYHYRYVLGTGTFAIQSQINGICVGAPTSIVLAAGNSVSLQESFLTNPAYKNTLEITAPGQINPPNTLDLNNDGTPDSQQTTIANTSDDTSGNIIFYVFSKNNKPISVSKKGYDYYQSHTYPRYASIPFGMVDFTISNALPNEVNTVDIGFMMTSTEFDTFMTDALKTRTKSNNTNERVITTADIQNTRLRVVKWVPSTPGGTDFDFRDFTSKISKIDTTQPATTVNGKSYKKIVVSLDLVDGQYGDTTGVDGKIVDPIGLALIPETPAATLSKTGIDMTTILISTTFLGAIAIGATVIVRYKRKLK